MHLWEADLLASTAHRGQKDKIGVDYIHHVRAVAEGLAPFDTEIRIAGVLHDIVEDTDWTIEHLLKAGVPARSVRIVDAVTKRDGMTKEQQIEQVVAAGHGAVLVKISDNAHNSLESRIQQISGQVNARKTQDRLRAKYEAARKVLWRNANEEDVEKILAIVNPPLLEQFRRDRNGPRPEISTLEVAQRWLAGESMEVISVSLNCSPGLVSSRVAKARTQFPELPWSDRKPTDRSGGSRTRAYVEMNDGKPGESRLREGSVVRGRTAARRGM